jgi:hypothetical protein
MSQRSVIKVNWLCPLCQFGNRSSVFAQEHQSQIVLCEGCDKESVLQVQFTATVRRIES